MRKVYSISSEIDERRPKIERRSRKEDRMHIGKEQKG